MELTAHIKEQAANKGIALDAIMEVLANPQTTYGSFHKDANGNRVPYVCKRHNVPQQKWTGVGQGIKLCVSVNTCCQQAITFWLDQVETELRPDQKNKGVKGYYGKDGFWRKG